MSRSIRIRDKGHTTMHSGISNPKKVSNSGTKNKKIQQIPVTVLSGFLGAGKTTLLNNLLAQGNSLKGNKKPKTHRFAVIVNDMSIVNLDAQFIKRTTETVIEMSNGCICCTLREDLLDQLLQLACSEEPYDAILIESTGIGEPLHIAETFSHALRLADVPQTTSDDNAEAGLEMQRRAALFRDKIRLDCMVTVVDASQVWYNFKSHIQPAQDCSSNNNNNNIKCNGEATSESSHSHTEASSGQPTIGDLLLDQLQFANVIVLNKVDLLPPIPSEPQPKKKRKLTATATHNSHEHVDGLRQEADAAAPSSLQEIRSIISDLNPLALIIPATRGNVQWAQVVNTGLFSFDQAATDAKWFADDWGESVPESEEYGISSVVLTTQRPFHCQRLHDFLVTEGKLRYIPPSDEAASGMPGTSARTSICTTGTDNALTTETSTHDDRCNSSSSSCSSGGGGSSRVRALNQVIRAKGYIWMEDSPSRCVVIQIAGNTLQMHRGNKWWVEVSRDTWPSSQAFQQEVVAHMDDAYGDRRHTLVIIGVNLDKAGIVTAFESCMWSMEEMAANKTMLVQPDNHRDNDNEQEPATSHHQLYDPFRSCHHHHHHTHRQHQGEEAGCDHTVQ